MTSLHELYNHNTSSEKFVLALQGQLSTDFQEHIEPSNWAAVRALRYMPSPVRGQVRTV